MHGTQATLHPSFFGLDVANLSLEIIQFLLYLGVLLGHLLVLLLPLIAILLEGLDFALKVASLNIGLTESGDASVSLRISLHCSQLAYQYAKG